MIAPSQLRSSTVFMVIYRVVLQMLLSSFVPIIIVFGTVVRTILCLRLAAIERKYTLRQQAMPVRSGEVTILHLHYLQKFSMKMPDLIRHSPSAKSIASNASLMRAPPTQRRKTLEYFGERLQLVIEHESCLIDTFQCFLYDISLNKTRNNAIYS